MGEAPMPSEVKRALTIADGGGMTALYRTTIVMILSGMLLTQSGCLLVAAAAGTGAGVAYVRGDLETSVEAQPDQVAAATEKAMKDLDIAVISTSSSSIDAKVVGRTARDTKLTVVAKSQGSKFSELSVRAGVFGDDAIQHRLLEQIKTNLSAPTTQPSSDTVVSTKSE